MHLPLEEINVGTNTKKDEKVKRYRDRVVIDVIHALLSDAPIFPQVRKFYISLMQYLVKKLPLRNTFLRSLAFMGLPQSLNEKAVLHVAQYLPTVISPDCMDALATEVRLYNCTGLPEDLRSRIAKRHIGIDEAWKCIHELRQTTGDEQFPLLCRLFSAICTLFHGNADAERAIGKSHDIDASGKRERLSGKLSCL